MALPLKYCLILLIVFMWQCNNLTSTCPEICFQNTNKTLCQKCSYNVSLKNSIKTQPVAIHCDGNGLVLKSVNKTPVEATLRYTNSCTEATPTFYSFVIRNNSFNKISIDIKAPYLRELDLSSNKLQYLSKGIFNHYGTLKKLFLSKNEISKIFEESFNGLTVLELLDLSENNLTSLANVFTPLKNLQHLNLSRNNIEFIHENYFNNCWLQHLDVSHNNLRKLAPGALQLLPNLARLLLTDNPHLGVNQLDTQLLVGTGRRLQQVDASRTGLFQVPEAFTHSVRFLSLVGNKIPIIRCGDLDSYPLLQSLDFSVNKITTVEEDSIGRLEMLLYLNLNKNLLKSVPRSLPDELKYLSISSNLINNLTIPDFKNLPNLRILLLQCNQIQYIDDHVFDDLLALEVLDLSNNPLKALSSSTFEGPLSLRDLRLCHLNVSLPAQDGAFPVSSPETVQLLHLEASPGLVRQLLADSAALAALTHLQYLDIRMNNLTEIRNDLLFYLVQLKTLRLHGNKINCSAELWLKDWMNSSKTLSDNETCHYSTSESQADITKYNCTFPESFSKIIDALPAVNLYSTQMINKLLRYYGYANNKTEKGPTNKTTEKSLIRELFLKKIPPRSENAIPLSDYLNESALVKARESSKVLDQNKLQNDQFSIDHRFLDIEPISVSNSNSKKVLFKDTRRKNRSGKRLNTPVNITKKTNTEKSSESKSSLGATTLNVMGNSTEGYTTNSNDRTEYSPYQSVHPSYAQYIGTAGVCSLIMLSLVLWASFRLKYRRRRREPVSESDQIEVANISGGVLW